MFNYLKNKSFIYVSINIILTFLIIPLQTNNISSGIFCIAFSVLAYKFFKNNFDLLQFIIFSVYTIVGSQLRINSIYYSYILLIAFIINLIFMFLKDKKIFFNIYPKKHLLVFSVVIIYMLFAMLFLVKNASVGIYHGKYQILMVLIFFLFLCNIRYYSFNKKIFLFFKIALIFILLLGFIQIFGINIGVRSFFIDYPFDPIIEPVKQHIPTAFYYNPNNYGMFLVAFLCMILGEFLYTKDKKTQIINFLIINAIYFQLITTMSRISFIGSILILVFAVILFIFKTKKDYKQYIKFAIILFSLFIIIFSFTRISFLENYLNKLSQDEEILIQNDNSLNENISDDIIKNQHQDETEITSGNIRLNLMLNIFEGVIKEKNYFGLGVGEVYEYILNKGNTDNIHNIHSLHFEILGAYGIFVFILYIVFIFYVLIRLIIIYLKSKILNGFIFSNLLMFVSLMFTCFAPSTVLNNSLFFMLLASSVGCSYIKIPNLSLNKNMKVEK